MHLRINCRILAIASLSASVLMCSCARNPEVAKAKYLAEGQTYMKQGRFGDAIVEFRNALRQDPRFADGYYQLAQAHLAEHDWRAAFLSLQRAIELDPTDLDARLDRGRLLLDAHQFTKAEDDANYILEKQPDDRGAYQLLGAALIEEERPDKALAALGKLAALNQNDAALYVNMALVEVTLHRWANAEQHLKDALAMDPAFVQAYMDLVNFYRLQNRDSEAEQALQQGLAQNPRAITLYVELASMLSSEGKTADAGSVLDKLRSTLPTSPDAPISSNAPHASPREIVLTSFMVICDATSCQSNPLNVIFRGQNVTQTSVGFDSAYHVMGLSGGSAEQQAWSSNSNVLLAQTTRIGNPTIFSGPLASGSVTSFPGVASGTYSLTLDDILTGAESGKTTFAVGDGDISATPEPRTMMLFGTGLLLFAGVLRRRLA
jgi:tetratricopeptide (TPR) repeat protein